MARALALFTALLLCSSVAFADESDTCENDCPDGQIRTSFLDGHQVNCVCMPPGPGMTDDSGIQNGGTEPEQG